MTSFNPFHDSLGTLTNFNDSSQPTETSFIASKSISTNIMDYICPCDEHELSDGLQHLEEQLQNISNEELFYRFCTVVVLTTKLRNALQKHTR